MANIEHTLEFMMTVKLDELKEALAARMADAELLQSKLNFSINSDGGGSSEAASGSGEGGAASIAHASTRPKRAGKSGNNLETTPAVEHSDADGTTATIGVGRKRVVTNDTNFDRFSGGQTAFNRRFLNHAARTGVDVDETSYVAFQEQSFKEQDESSAQGVLRGVNKRLSRMRFNFDRMEEQEEVEKERAAKRAESAAEAARKSAVNQQIKGENRFNRDMGTYNSMENAEARRVDDAFLKQQQDEHFVKQQDERIQKDSDRAAEKARKDADKVRRDAEKAAAQNAAHTNRSARAADDAYRQQQKDEDYSDWKDKSDAYDRTLPGKLENFSKKYLSGYGGRFLKGALFTAGMSGAEEIHALTEQKLTGRANVMAQAQASWGFMGGIAGAAIGSIFPGYGTLVGAGIGTQLGQMGGQFFNADEQAKMLRTRLGMEEGAYSAMLNQEYGNVSNPNYFINSHGEKRYRPNDVNNPKTISSALLRSRDVIESRADRVSKAINIAKLGQYADDNQYGITPDNAVSGYLASASALREAGINPETDMGINVGTIDMVPDGTFHKGKATHTTRKWVEDERDITSYFNGTYKGSSYTKPAMKNATTVASSTDDAPSAIAITSPGQKYNENVRASVIAKASADSKGDSVGIFGSIRKQSGHWVDIEDAWENVPNLKGVEGKANQNIAEYFNEQTEKKFLAAAPDVFNKVVKPILANITSYGGTSKKPLNANLTDILNSLGPTSAFTFDQITVPDGQAPRASELTYLQAKEGRSLSQRAKQLAGYAFTNKGTAALDAINDEMNTFKDIPGYKDSVTYRAMLNEKTNARLQQYQDYQTQEYGIPMTKLQGQRDRMDVSPYSPGNRMILDMSMIRANQTEATMTQARMDSLRKNHTLSEEVELAMTSQIEGFKTNVAKSRAALIDGVDNRIPAMSAGAPSFTGRVDSRWMEAAQFGMINHPFRGAGALSSAQLAKQEGFFNKYLGDDAAPHSRTAGLNNPYLKTGTATKGGSDTHVHVDTKNVEQLLKTLIDVVRSSNKSPKGSIGALSGAQQRQSTPY